MNSEIRGKPIRAAFLAKNDCRFVDRIFDMPRRERIAGKADLFKTVLTPKNLSQYRTEATQVEALFICWGFPLELLTAENFSKLRVVFYSGGSVKGFARPLLERGITVVGARAANAIAVAHFCLGQIILSCKGYFRNTRLCREPGRMREGGIFAGPGLYGERIALLGMGVVARELVPLLLRCDLKVLAVDPYLTPTEARALGVEMATMEEAFTKAYVVSNHLPNLPELERVLSGKLFALMRQNATFINTGRGAQVNEPELIETFQKRPDLTALLDVTDPEPPLTGSPLYELPNVELSTHIAGALNDEVRRQGDFVIEEFERFVGGQPLLHAEKLEFLDRLA